MNDRRNRSVDRDEKVKAWVKDKKPMPKKKSAEDILNEREAKAEKRSIARANRKTWLQWLTVSNVVGILAIIGAGVFAFFGNQAANIYDAEFLENESTIADLKEAALLEALPESEGEQDTILSEAAAAIDNAAIAANELAQLQNIYQTITIETVALEGGGAEVIGAEEMAANSDAIATFFPNLDAAGVSGAWYTMNVQRDDGVWVVAPAGSFAWEFGETWTVTGPNTARVVWQARDTNNDELLAWAIGNWNNELQGFDELQIGVTSQGQSHVGSAVGSGYEGSTQETEGDS